MIGKTISHYRILEKLGQGGMGVVYKAEDTTLRRTVALKFLPLEFTGDSEAKERFVREAQAASSLNHPNICTVHEIGETEDGRMFICMACYEGETLRERAARGPLALMTAIEIVIQIARGLGKAHERGIVHRDIKSANIVTTDDEHVRILDFGLAKLLGQSDLTSPGEALGTVNYMSPEQARGGDVDHRTDIWALGVVLYEIVSGKLPFRGGDPQVVLRAILSEEPEPITAAAGGAPVELERIVGKATAKNPDDRYQSAADILLDLETLKERLRVAAPTQAVAPASTQSSIAVLPFTNMSADPEQEYFCDGMAEEIINALAKLEDLRVVARTSAFAFKDAKLDVRDMGRKLGVGTVLEGSVRKSGNRLRITAQLINVADGYHLWSERYNRVLEDVFEIQDEIALAIVDKLKIKLRGEARTTIARCRTEDIEAYNLYLKGRFHWNKRDPEEVRKGMSCFRKAIEREPMYAPAYAGLADSYTVLENYGSMPPEDAFREAEEAASKAIEIDGDSAEACASLAWIKMARDGDWQGAEDGFLRAIELNPGYATARNWYSLYLSAVGRQREAVHEIRKAKELDPLSPTIGANVGSILINMGEYDQAVEELSATLEMNPTFVVARLNLATAYVATGRHEEAIEEVGKVINNPGGERWRAALVYALAAAGERDRAMRMLEDIEKQGEEVWVPGTLMAAIHAALGNADRAFETLGEMCEEHSSETVQMLTEGVLKELRSDPRFADIRKRVGL